MVRVMCCTFRGPRLAGFGIWPACVLQPNRFLPAWLLLFFVHLFYGKAVLPTDNYIAVPAALFTENASNLRYWGVIFKLIYTLTATFSLS